MARRSQCSDAGDNPLDPNYLPPHYREEYRMAIDALIEEDLEGYYQLLQRVDVVDFLSSRELEYIQKNAQVPHLEACQPELQYMDPGLDGSSDTYWPVHSDVDAPGLDLGWPDLYRFIGPTEVTTLVNPAEPNMPTIKEQARRLIKNAQQVIAIVMDMFTDVDIFSDILGAAMRNVAVYIILDERNANHFVNMAMNCRVNLDSIQFLRVRTVSGVTYRCRSGITFTGQMMDRFLLTDCRAVLSGNYSFMWSFEKLHRCLAHLFLGQLVTTFDEEFRILYAQSQPLILENILAQMEELNQPSDKQYSSERTPMYRDIKKILPMDASHSEGWPRHPYDDRMDADWKKLPVSKHEPIQRMREQGPGELYNRYSLQQLPMDQPYDQGPSRMPINLMEKTGFKRHSYAEGAQGRRSPYQFMQHMGGMHPENQGRQFQREQQPYPRMGPEAGFGVYDRLQGQGYQSKDQYPPEPELPQEMETTVAFDPVLNYLSSAKNVGTDQGSDKLSPPEDMPFGSPHPKRLSAGQPYACQTSPTASFPKSDQNPLFPVPNKERKDPSIKQGLRNWRISSYLSTYEDTGDDEGIPPATMATDPFEEPLQPMQRRSSGPELSFPKIPNTREFKIPAVPRASQLPSFMKLPTPELPKKLPEDCASAAETKKTPTPSESSSTNDSDKTEEQEQKDSKDTVMLREEAFRRKYSGALQRNSRLRSSLIFSSQLEQHADQEQSTSDQPNKENDQTNEKLELPFATRLWSQKKTREPFQWSRYIKSATFDNATTEETKTDDGGDKAGGIVLAKEELSKVNTGNTDTKESCKPVEVEQIKEPQKTPQIEQPKSIQPINPTQSLLSNSSYVDMSDPDQRFKFFKELAAARKAEKSAAKVSPGSAVESQNKTSVKMEKPGADEVSKNVADTSFKTLVATSEMSEKTPQNEKKTASTETFGPGESHQDVCDKITKSEKLKKEPSIDLKSNTCKDKQNNASTDSEKIKWKESQASISTSVSPESQIEEANLLIPATKESSQSHPLTTGNAKVLPISIPSSSVGQRKGESTTLNFTSQDSGSTSTNNTPSSERPASESDIHSPGQLQSESSTTLSTSSDGAASPAGSDSSPQVPFSKLNPQSMPTASKFYKILSESSSSQSLPSESSSSQNIPSKPVSAQDIQLYSSVPQFQSLEPISSHTIPSDSTCETPPLSLEQCSTTCPQNSDSSPDSNPTELNHPFSPLSVQTPQTSVKVTSESTSVPIPPTVLVSNLSQVQSSSSKQSASSETTSVLSSANDSQLNTGSSITNTDDEGSHSLKPDAKVSSISCKASDEVFDPKGAELVESLPLSDAVLTSPTDSKTESSVDPTISEAECSILCPSPDKTKTDPSPSICTTKSSSEPPPTESNSLPHPALSSDIPPEASASSTLPTTVPCQPLSTASDGSVKAGTTASANISPLDSLQTSKESLPLSISHSVECASKDSSVCSEPSVMSETLTELKSTEAHSSEQFKQMENNNVSKQCEAHKELGSTDSVSEEAGSKKKVDSGRKAGVEKKTNSENKTGAKKKSVGETKMTAEAKDKAENNMSADKTMDEEEKTELDKKINEDTKMNAEIQNVATKTNGEVKPEEEKESDPEKKTNNENKTNREMKIEAEKESDLGKKTEDKTNRETKSSGGKKSNDEAADQIDKLDEQEPVVPGAVADEVKENNGTEAPESMSDDAPSQSPQSKQPKASQSRYHSSTAGVISSSNLRDDTKLLLGQLSANSQSRTESTKDAAVTDDEKEDDKSTSGGIRARSLGRMAPNQSQEREKLLEKIQSMRKERKVYSRFEIAP